MKERLWHLEKVGHNGFFFSVSKASQVLSFDVFLAIQK